MSPLRPPLSGAMPPVAFTRRDALRLLAAQMAVTLAGCGKPDQEIVPYVRKPERVVPGEPLRFATSLPLTGYARGVLAISIDGRPIKIEGNPLHPASLGATDVFAEAAVLSLYDPDRSRTVQHSGAIASCDMFLTALAAARERLRAHGGHGLRLLTGRITSPTLARQIDALLAHYPAAVWHAYDPADDAGRAGAELAYGRPLAVLHDIDRARRVLVLDADPLGPGPDQIRSGHGFAAGRDPGADPTGFSRWYALYATPTLTSAKTDSQLALPPHDIHNAAIAVANAFGAGLPDPLLSPPARTFVAAAAHDLQSHRGEALVIAGRTLAPETHALVHWINARLAAPLRLIEPPDHIAGRKPASLPALADALDGGDVAALAILGANPVYDAPPELAFAEKLGKARLSLHHGLYADETARRCDWHVPASHPLESWSDLRATDGTASLVQPLIKPLYDSRDAHAVLAALMGSFDASAYDLVRETWRATAGADFDSWWRQALEDGVIAGTAAPAVAAGEPTLPAVAPKAAEDTLTLVLTPDPCVWDGSYANNAWLQECPKPLTKEVWGNALGIGPADAERLGLGTGDVVRIAAGGRALTVPVLVMPGHAARLVSLTLGYGRRHAGAIGNGVGVDAYSLRLRPWLVERVALTRTQDRQEVLTTQRYVQPEGEIRELFPVLSLAALARGEGVEARAGALPSFFSTPVRGDQAWAMAIDAAACIGCNACVVACQAENNVPVIGPEEIARGRDMHWLRVDVYDHGTSAAPEPGFQPVPCMHCEKAPCEPVCPVAASVHDSEGLNLQVYNRCVGTRFCEANCPYKVRRFNFFGYADGQPYANLGADVLKAQKNPEVTVRARGVMEKCTYCIQRIARVRAAAARGENECEVVTACQSACPTGAITFGDLTRENSAVRRRKRGPRHYALLGHLDTQPRTTYLAEVRNPNPAIDGGDA
ncbi:MAG: 4Fe-4S dicluster domain-containing protein [Xanthobacteraceae bacterium]